MKSMTLTSYGAEAPFVEADLPRPLATPGHVVLRVKATSVNTIDTMIKNAGKDLPLSPDLPAVLGMDFAGVIEEIGEGVTGFAVGDEVYGCAGGLADLQGALAEFMRADARLIAHKPKSLSMREATYIVDTGTSVRSASRTELRPATTSVEPAFFRGEGRDGRFLSRPLGS